MTRDERTAAVIGWLVLAIHAAAAGGLLGVLLLTLWGSPAMAQTVVTQYTYSTTCTASVASAWSDCSTLEHLYEWAVRWSHGYWPEPKPLAGNTPETPSIVLVSSATIPISAIFRFHQPPPIRTPRGDYISPLPKVSYFQPMPTGDLTQDTFAAAKLDRQVTATRALDIPPIHLLPNRGRANAPNGVITEVNDTLSRQASGWDVLWGLWGFHLPNVRYRDVIDQRSGEQHRVFVGDTITIVFDDGSSLTVRLQKSTKNNSLIFVVVAGSARNPAGDPYTITPKPATPGNGAQWLPSNAHTSGRLLGPGYSCTFPAGQVCTTDGGMTRCANNRAFIGPC